MLSSLQIFKVNMSLRQNKHNKSLQRHNFFPPQLLSLFEQLRQQHPWMKQSRKVLKEKKCFNEIF